MTLSITLSVSLMVIILVLMICWIIVLAHQTWWAALAIGTVLFVMALAGVGLYLYLHLREMQLNQRQANFVDSVTHELKSPLASLKLCLETLQLRQIPPAKQQEFFRLMMEDLDRLERLINHLLEAGQLDALVTDGVAEDVEIEPLIQECASSARISQKKPTAKVTYDGQPAAIHGVRLALEMIFGNLLDNALKYCDSDPEVVVQIRPRGTDRLSIRVIDNGIGVPDELRHRIFGLFYRGGEELTRRHKGTGLGLYIVRTLVRKMRGKVSAHNRAPQAGSIFEVELPGRFLPRRPTDGGAASRPTRDQQWAAAASELPADSVVP